MDDKTKNILDDYKKTRSPFRVAKAHNIDVKDVWELIETNQSYLQHHPERHGGYGRPELRDFIVARRWARGPKWDNETPEIAEARAQYEAGIIDMATGRDGGWEILYAFPRKKVKPRPGCWIVESVL